MLTLRSPIDGVVLQRFQESEAVVPQGQPLVEVADLSTLEVDRPISSRPTPCASQPGMPVLIEQWGGGTPLKGPRDARRAVGIPQSVRARRRGAAGLGGHRLRRSAGAWQALGDGYRVEARVVVWEQRRCREGADQQPVSAGQTGGRCSSSRPAGRACAPCASASGTERPPRCWTA